MKDSRMNSFIDAQAALRADVIIATVLTQNSTYFTTETNNMIVTILSKAASRL